MYLWNTKALAKELKEGTLNEWEKFKYFITGVMLYELLISIPSDTDYNLFEWVVISVSGFLITFLGIYMCYKINKTGDGLNFIERFICISLPIMIKLSVWSLLPLFIFVLLMGTEQEELASFDSFLGIFIIATVIFITVLFYWRVYVHMKWISHNNTDIINS